MHTTWTKDSKYKLYVDAKNCSGETCENQKNSVLQFFHDNHHQKKQLIQHVHGALSVQT